MIQSSFSGINFDANASYGLLPEVIDAIAQYSSILNPSSIHRGGQFSRSLIEESRSEISQLLNLKRGHRIIFTSGATESNNTAIFSKFQSTFKNSNLVISSIEHPSVKEAAYKLKEKGVEIREVAPSHGQEFRAEAFLDACDENTRLISVIFANNETGQILPIESVFSKVKSKYPHILCHSDAVQALGKIQFDFENLNCDALSISAHKIGGLSGVGALVVRDGVSITPMLIGGPQEVRFRAGTENVLGIISFGVAAKVARNNLSYRIQRMNALKQALIKMLEDRFQNSEIKIQFSNVQTLPNTISLRVPEVSADDLLVKLDLGGLYVSAGSACSSGKPEPSYVLLSMGLSEEEAKQTVRISLRSETTYDELCNGAKILIDSIESLKITSSSPDVLLAAGGYA